MKVPKYNPNFIGLRQARTINTIESFLYEDLTKLDYHTNELIDNLYVSGQKENFKKDIEEIERLLSYWQMIAKNLKK